MHIPGSAWERRRSSHWICSAVLVLISSLTARSEENWKPIRRPNTHSVSYHGNGFGSNLGNQRYLAPRVSLDRDFALPSAINQVSATRSSHITSEENDQCSLYKVGFPDQYRFFQYAQYKVELPTLKEFTLCMWHKFENHSNDHPLFSYSAGDNPKAIFSWVSNTDAASYFSMAVRGHTFYRLNYPLKLNKWYHSCQSWNGKTGEWQIWVNGERVGRGFHNRLVGLDIKGGGIAISGQDQAFIGDLLEGKEPEVGSGGMLGEITMLQLYSVALTAGKAHKDHKHHHVHHFNHDGSPSQRQSGLQQAPVTAPPNIPNSFLAGGQIMQSLRLNLGLPQGQTLPVQLPNGAQVPQQFINGQFGPTRTLSEQLINGGPFVHARQRIPGPIPNIPAYQYGSLGPSRPSTVLLTGGLVNPANVQYIDDTDPNHALFKRNQPSETHPQSKRSKRDNPEKELMFEETAAADELSVKKQTKRGLVSLSDGSLIDDSLLGNAGIQNDVDFERFQQSLLLGLAGLGENVPVQKIQKEKVDEREPAEAEVRAVMDMCSGCAPEPFQKALIIGWRITGKKLYSGAAYYEGLSVCGAF